MSKVDQLRSFMYIEREKKVKSDYIFFRFEKYGNKIIFKSKMRINIRFCICGFSVYD